MFYVLFIYFLQILSYICIFCPAGNNNIILIKLFTEIWVCDNIDKRKSDALRTWEVHAGFKQT